MALILMLIYSVLKWSVIRAQLYGKSAGLSLCSMSTAAMHFIQFPDGSCSLHIPSLSEHHHSSPGTRSGALEESL